MPNSHTSPKVIATIVVPIRDENPKMIEDLIHETITTFKGTVDIQIVDDGSKERCPFATLFHPVTLGYGASIKTGICNATGELIITMDGDGQHRIRDAQRLLEFIQEFPDLEMVIGDRRIKEQTFKRWLGRKILNWSATLFSNRWIADLNSGMRVFNKKTALSYEPILSNGFSYTTTLTLSFLADNRKVDWLPIKVNERKNGYSKVRLWKDGIWTLYQIVRIGGALRTRRLRKLWRSIPSWVYLTVGVAGLFIPFVPGIPIILLSLEKFRREVNK